MKEFLESKMHKRYSKCCMLIVCCGFILVALAIYFLSLFGINKTLILCGSIVVMVTYMIVAMILLVLNIKDVIKDIETQVNRTRIEINKEDFKKPIGELKFKINNIASKDTGELITFNNVNMEEVLILKSISDKSYLDVEEVIFLSRKHNLSKFKIDKREKYYFLKSIII